MGFKAYAGSSLAATLAGLTDTDHVVVLIYLNGGNDGLNTVIPLQFTSELNAVRPHVILPENRLLPLTDDLALHPSLTGLKSMYDEGQLHIIQNVGYPDQDFSHFRSTDIWMSGADSDKVVTSGWSGRYLNYEYPNYPIGYPNDENPDPLAIEIGYANSLMFQGPASSMGFVINDPEGFYNLLEDVEGPLPDTLAADQLSYVRLVKRQSQEYGIRVRDAAQSVSSQMDFPATGLAEQLKIVSRLIAGGLQTRLYMVQLGGFDTHDAQVEDGDHTVGEHANLLKELDDAIVAFMADLKFHGQDDRVVGATISEFGRRVVSNASLGTDHGSAAPLFMFGKHVNGGVTGNAPEISADMIYSDNLEHEVDFREVYYSLFKDWFCAPEESLGDIFLADYTGLDVVNNPDSCIVTSTREINQQSGESLISVFPNRTFSMTRISFKSAGGMVMIRLVDATGKVLADMERDVYPAGEHQISWDMSPFSAGIYYVQILQNGLKQAKPLVKL